MDPTTKPKLIPHIVTFLAPEGFTPVSYFHVAVSQEGKYFVNAPFDEPELVLALQAQGVMAASMNIAQQIRKEPKEESRIFLPGKMRGMS